jgi:integrase/recombinase XerD
MREHVIDFAVKLHDEGKAPKTINLYKDSIKYFAREVLGRRDVADIRMSKEPRRLPVVLTRDEVEKLFAAARNLKHRLILQVAYASGLRISEVRTLRVQDLDLVECVIHVHAGKGNKDRITVISPKILGGLHQMCKGKEPRDYVFMSDMGDALHVRTLGEVFHAAKRQAGITKPATFHSLRHSFATHLIEQGTDIRHIQVLLGHANIRTTQGYTHVTRPQVQRVVSPL